MSCILGRRTLGALAACFFIVAVVLPGHSYVSAQAKPGAGHGRTTVDDDQYTAIPITGLPDNMIWTVAFDLEDRPWVGTNRGGATQLDDGTWRWLTTADGLAGDSVKAYLFQPDGEHVGRHRSRHRRVYLP